MAGERELPGLGLLGFWNYESDGWNAGMDANLRTLSALVHLAAGSRTTALPGSPTNGQIRIVPANASSNANAIAVRDNGAWVYLAPKPGMRAYIVDTDEYAIFDGTAWEAEADAAGLPDAPADGKSYARRNGEWVEVVTGGGGEGGGIEEAPTDGKQYGRQAGAWTEIAASGGAAVSSTRWRMTGVLLHDSNSSIRLAEIELNNAAGRWSTGGVARASQADWIGANVSILFDGSTSSSWRSSAAWGVGDFIEYEGTTPAEVTSIALSAWDNVGMMPSAFTVEAFVDGAWTAVRSFDNVPAWTANERREFSVAPESPPVVDEAPMDGKPYARKDGAWAVIAEPEDPNLFSDIRIVWTGLNDPNYAGLAEVQFNGARPVGGTAYASSEFNGTYAASKAFDADPASYWSSVNLGASTGHLGYQTAPVAAPSTITLTAPVSPYQTYAPAAFRVEGRTPNGAVTVLGEFTPGTWTAGESKTFSVADAAKPVVGEGIDKIVKLTQTEYDALPTKSETTLYVVAG